MRPECNIREVIWANKYQETGGPFDFMVIYNQPNNQKRIVYIEVKTTMHSDRSYFKMSINEVAFAKKHGENFHVYRVFNAGKPSVRLGKIENLALKIDEGSVKLCLVV